MNNERLILASASPRRQELLAQIGVSFTTVSVDVDESWLKGESPEAYVERLAIEKARSGWMLSKGCAPVLGSDTTVVCDNRILGKPANREQAIAMLQLLSGKQHQVMTAIALVWGRVLETRVVVTDVFFRPLGLTEIETYWETGESHDKAGAYGIQGFGAVFVERIEGSYSAVVGLPLQETADLLAKMSVSIWQCPE
jgi:septum formation protein